MIYHEVAIPKQTAPRQNEFLPAAEEIIETPSSPLGHAVLWVIVGLMIATGIWMYVGKIDVVVIATGKVAPDGNIKIVQAPSQGVVQTIRVKEGQHVARGDVLIQLDNGMAVQAADIAERLYETAKLERMVVKMIDEGNDPHDTIAGAPVSQDIKDDMARLAQSRQVAMGTRRAALTASIAQANAQLDTELATQETIQTNLQSAQTARTQAEHELETASIFDRARIQSHIQEITTQMTALKNSQATQQQRITQARAGVAQATSSLEGYGADMSSTTTAAVIDQDKKIAELEGALAKARKERDQQTLTAPVDGTVLSVAVTAAGQVVSPVQPLVMIVPSEATLYVDGLVSPSDIGFVKPGQEAVIKVDTFSFQRYGYIKGRIDQVSPDVVSEDKKPPMYKARIAITTPTSSKGQTMKLIPGMTTTNEGSDRPAPNYRFFPRPVNRPH
jgi:HlyD family type I secretion membrane fusion protein